MPHSAPVGVFDSGYGGISVLRSVRAVLPYESYLYFGDNANAPYGVRPGEEIRRLSLAAGQRLADRGVKAIVIACNTATGMALSTLRAAFPMPVIGIQPALEAAQRLRRDGKVLALATPATFQTDIYTALYARHGQHTISLPCPGLMEFVEMFKAPIKVLHPLLTATQEGNYNTTEGMGAVPFEGIILAHSNESEWQAFRNNKNNEAFLKSMSGPAYSGAD
mgnify:CR=1 FL=1